MPLALASSPDGDADGDLLADYLAFLHATGRPGNRTYLRAVEVFLGRWSDPALWAAEPLEVRLEARYHTRSLLMFLMLHQRLRPGYDYLLRRTLLCLWRWLPATPLHDDLHRFRSAVAEIGYTASVAEGAAGLIAVRLLIQTGRPLRALTITDTDAFEAALDERDAELGSDSRHYRRALFAARSGLYHLGITERPPTPRGPRPALTFDQRMIKAGVADWLRPTVVAYLDRLTATHATSTVCGTATRLAMFGRHLANVDPQLRSLTDLDRRRHIESYLTATANATRLTDGAPISIAERRCRVIVLNCFFNDIGQWGWPEAPPRRMLFPRDIARREKPLPRYLPPDHDRRLADALRRSPKPLEAGALLLARATGMRLGELLDLELDCVHEIPGQGAWLKVPLGKLDTERMVPLDDEALAIVDQIAAARSPGRPLPHPRHGRPAEFLLTHHGKRLSPDTVRKELYRASVEAGLEKVTPHQLRHTYATALVNAGVSLQALMALLGHSSAEMSLRYARLFDSTVRADYERALTLAKERLGPVLPEARTHAPDGDWRELPLIKSRMSGGYCLRTAAQGVCAYTNICEHCPNFRSDPAFLAVLSAQRADAQALADDARRRGWDTETARHQVLVKRIDELIAKTDAA